MRSIAAALLLLGGCSVYDETYDFQPSPLEVLARAPEQPEIAAVRMLVTIIGVRRESREESLPASVEVALRVENRGAGAVTIDPSSMTLVAGNLVEFPAPIVRPPVPRTVAPGDTDLFHAYFPFPGNASPGGYDLDGLILRWTIETEGRATAHSALFQRIRYEYAAPSSWHYSGGTWWHSCW